MLRRALIPVAVLTLAANGPAVSANNPYQSIIERNVFGLKAPQEVLPPTTQPAAPKIIPTGLTTVVGRKLALFKVQFPAAPNQPAKEEPFTLAEGQRESGIEVVRIDESSGKITFNNNGNLVILDLERDGAKVPSTPAVPHPGGPGVVANPPPGAPAPSPVPGALPSHTNTALRGVPTRQPPAPPVPAILPAQTSVSLPAPTTTQNASQKPLTPEEQALLIELEREANKGKVQTRPQPPLPPTPISPQ